jgi:thiol-disulfide isomerase/thioredoxin
LARAQLKHRPLDAEQYLPIALGAAIEVKAQVMAARGERGEALAFLRNELATYRNTSIRTRIQKNINLIDLTGKPAPALDERVYLGPKPQPLAALKGHPVLLFFWAHWCGDCKQEVEEIARLQAEYKRQGLVVIGPTQHYGYVANGMEATPDQELQYIELVRQRFYSALPDMPVPVSAENFNTYGASTTPTLVLLDGKGVVRMYHPGTLPYSELAAALSRLLAR